MMLNLVIKLHWLLNCFWTLIYNEYTTSITYLDSLSQG
jgi:hypothetical protein